MKKFTCSLGLVLGISALSLPARATLLLPLLSPQNSESPVPNSAVSGTLVSSSFCSAANPKITDPVVNGSPETLLADTCVISKGDFFGGVDYLNVNLREVVYQEAVTNTLDFYYQFWVNSSKSGVSLVDMFGLPFNNVSTYVGTANQVSLFGGFGTTTGSNKGNDPNKVVEGNIAGSSPNSQCSVAANDCLTFDYSPNLTQGEFSLTLVVSTNATKFQTDEIGFDVTGAPGHFDPILGFLAPVGVNTPEPVSIVLMGTVLAGLAFFIRRKRGESKDLSVS